MIISPRLRARTPPAGRPRMRSSEPMLGRLERRHELALFTEITGPVVKLGAQPGVAELAGQLAVPVLAGDVVEEEVLQGDDVTLGAGDLGHVRDLARAVAQALGLHDDVDGTGALVAHRLRRQREAAHP